MTYHSYLKIIHLNYLTNIQLIMLKIIQLIIFKVNLINKLKKLLFI